MKSIRRSSQVGEGKAGLIIALVMLSIFIHTMVAFMPNYMRDNEFQDFVIANLKEVGAQILDDEDFYIDVVEEAVSLGIDLTEGDIEYEEGKANVSVIIHYEYTNTYLWGESVREITLESEQMKM